ncbi:hypothetical protein PNEG_04269 [Pneumocystis murina B123]|uniref:Uncharacterized protein n=1 Tax=Pneumocystis murina (strain B123) TaxID=1069680 RepID=A0A0W4ZX33_PNEMU|nr:hypothetical protein PNEG_04269 [Pneumocystis murina B123]KTW32932.1 hypothetical protein PNEG_04269 [Pneumocystis murina B123]
MLEEIYYAFNKSPLLFAKSVNISDVDNISVIINGMFFQCIFKHVRKNSSGSYLIRSIPKATLIEETDLMTDL